MKELYESLQLLGLGSLDAFWFPVGIWTVVALFVFALLRFLKFLNPLYHYHLRVATLAAIPLGLLSTFIVQKLAAYFQSPSFDGAIFVVETPLQFSITPGSGNEVFDPNWFEPNFLIGAASAFALLVSMVMIIRLILSYVTLKQLHTALCKNPLDQHNNEINAYGLGGIKVAYHDHPLVPFTFGYRNPIIVLPNAIKDDPEKIRMAIQHELVHIKRGDYLLQLFISVIESFFWFHPLIKQGTREIETWREISCDQEVLNVSGISLKSYASMLYELVPLNRGLGSFSVSMAVQNSTLKKRIKIMKYHKLHQSSLKRSLLFLFVMIVGVTLPIACSDMRGPQGLSPEELETATLQMRNATMEINGVEVSIVPGMASQGTAAFFINAFDYGVFKIAPRTFAGGKQAGRISGNQIDFEINGLNVRIISETEIIPVFKDSPVWVEHSATKYKGISHGITGAQTSLEDFFGEYKGEKSFNDDGDYFIVVEQMPELIGGLRSIQSRVRYPEQARQMGIEGRVVVQMIVNENGDVEEPRVVRGIGGGADEAALDAIKLAKFEPGIQRGRPVRVQYSLPIIFKLSDSEFSAPPQPTPNSQNDQEPETTFTATFSDGKVMRLYFFESSNGKLEFRVVDKDDQPVEGAVLRFEGDQQRYISGKNGLLTATGLEPGMHKYTVKHPDLGEMEMYVDME